MTITAAQVSELRKTTDCGMMDCKKALIESNGDMEKAIQILREKGIAKAANKASRIAAEGAIQLMVSDDSHQAVMIEVNSETDFVARDENFVQFAKKVVELALANQVTDIETLSSLKVDAEKTVEEVRQALVAKLGENIGLRRVAYINSDDIIEGYLHGSKIGVLVVLKGGDKTLAKDLAMHIAASKPEVISADQVSAESIEKEKEIYRVQAAESGKPADIIEKMVEGRVKKYLNEVCLLGQPFVKDPDISVQQLLEKNHANVELFIRYELGEGIQKKVDNFVEEVMAQTRA